MDRLKFLFNRLLAMVFVAAVIVSCDKDEDPPPPADLTMSTFTAGSVDLNGATAPNNVPVDATFTVTFNTNVDAATATESNITLTRNYDDTQIPLAVSASGTTVTITPEETLGSGTQYTFNIGTGLASTDGKALTSAIERSFTTEGTFAPSSVIAHFTFEDTAEDIVGDFDPVSADVVAITYTASRNAAAGKAATFDGDASIIEVPNGDQLINSENLSVSFWVKTNSTGHVNENDDPAGHFVVGLGGANGFLFEIFGSYSAVKFTTRYEWADGTTGTGGDLYFNGDGLTKDNGAWQGIEVRKDLTSSGGVEALVKDEWVHVVFVYDGAAKHRKMYFNGELMQRENFNLWPDGAAETTAVGVKFNDSDGVDNKFTFGFISSRASTEFDPEPWGNYDVPTSNHFKGQLDDVRFFHAALTDQEIQLMYNSEKP